MAMRRSFRVLLLSTFAGIVGLLILVVEQEMEYRKSPRVAALAGQTEVGFDVVSAWRQPSSSIIGTISGIISGSAQGSGGTFVSPLAITAQVERVNRTRFNTEAYDSITDNPFIATSVDPR